MKKRFILIAVCLIICSIMQGCANNRRAAHEKKETDNNSFFTGNEIYRGGDVYAEKYALCVEYVNQGRTRLNLYDTVSGTKVLYCFDSGCPHEPAEVNFLSGDSLPGGCIAYGFGGNTMSLREGCSYFCLFPDLIQADQEGRNRRSIAQLSEECAQGTGELYTKEYYFRQYVCNYEILETENSDGSISVFLGNLLEKRKVGIKGVFLKDGKQFDVFVEDDLYDLNILNLSHFQNRLYFVCSGLDVPFDTLPSFREDYEAYCDALKAHSCVRVYEYDISANVLNLIISEQGTAGYDFCNGYIVHISEHGRGSKLLNTDGSVVRELPFPVGTLVRSDRYILAMYYDEMTGSSIYYLYDPDNDILLNSAEIRNSEIVLWAAVDNSYYGVSNGQTCYISAEDFWKGNIDSKIVLTENDNNGR